MKKILFPLLIVTLLINKITFSKETYKFDKDGYPIASTTSLINDIADVLTDQEEIDLHNYIYSYFDTAQIAVVLPKTLNGEDKSSYTIELANRWGVGSKSNNGILIMIAPNERKYFTAIGYGLEGDLTDAASGKIQRNVLVPFLKTSNYYDGIKSLVKEYRDYLNPAAKQIRLEQEREKRVQYEKNKKLIITGLKNFFFFSLLFSFIYFVIYKIIKNRKIRKEEFKKMINELIYYKIEIKKIREFFPDVKDDENYAPILINIDKLIEINGNKFINHNKFKESFLSFKEKNNDFLLKIQKAIDVRNSFNDILKIDAGSYQIKLTRFNLYEKNAEYIKYNSKNDIIEYDNFYKRNFKLNLDKVLSIGANRSFEKMDVLLSAIILVKNNIKKLDRIEKEIIISQDCNKKFVTDVNEYNAYIENCINKAYNDLAQLDDKENFTEKLNKEKSKITKLLEGYDNLIFTDKTTKKVLIDLEVNFNLFEQIANALEEQENEKRRKRRSSTNDGYYYNNSSYGYSSSSSSSGSSGFGGFGGGSFGGGGSGGSW